MIHKEEYILNKRIRTKSILLSLIVFILKNNLIFNLVYNLYNFV